jgi:glucokinase
MSGAWNLVADIGGTNARFAVDDRASQALQCQKTYSVTDYDNFPHALEAYLAEAAHQGWHARPAAACLAAASPITGDLVRFTNSTWSLDRMALARELGADVCLINDFAAVGYAVIGLDDADWHALGGGAPQRGFPIGVLGAGTGLGVCSLVAVGGAYHVVEGEGGHVDFAPVDAQEIAVLQILSARFGRVSAERLLSGAGLVNIYTALAQLGGKEPVHDSAAAITDAALMGVESLAVRTLEMFCRVLGSTAGNLALTLGARGGIYIAGGIAPRFTDFLTRSEFRARFEAKGRFSSYLRDIPVRLVTREQLGLDGAAAYLRRRDG